jgi:hypothetical protein
MDLKIMFIRSASLRSRFFQLKEKKKKESRQLWGGWQTLSRFSA